MHRVQRRHLVGIIATAFILLATGVTAWSMTWTSCMVSMTAHSASIVEIGMFEDCDCSVPLAAYDWNGIVAGQVYEYNAYLKNTGNKGVYLSYEPTNLSFSDDQARFYIDVKIIETGTPCDMYPTPFGVRIDLPEKDLVNAEPGYFLSPGKAVKLTVVLTVESVVSGETYSWDLRIYGCTP